MITIHHLEYSQSFRLLWLMEELGAEYELKLYARDKTTRLAPADYKAVSPLGTAPVITDGNITLSETNAIMDYILDKYDTEHRLRPAAGTPERVPYLFWFHAAQGSMMPLLLFRAIFGMIKRRTPGLLRPMITKILGKAEAGFVAPRMSAVLAQAEKDLENRPWFAGQTVTAADIVMSYGMEAAAANGMITQDYPNCLAWVKRMHEHPTFIAAMEKDGKESLIFTS